MLNFRYPKESLETPVKKFNYKGFFKKNPLLSLYRTIFMENSNPFSSYS